MLIFFSHQQSPAVIHHLPLFLLRDSCINSHLRTVCLVHRAVGRLSSKPSNTKSLEVLCVTHASFSHHVLMTKRQRLHWFALRDLQSFSVVVRKSNSTRPGSSVLQRFAVVNDTSVLQQISLCSLQEVTRAVMLYASPLKGPTESPPYKLTNFRLLLCPSTQAFTFNNELLRKNKAFSESRVSLDGMRTLLRWYVVTNTRPLFGCKHC